LAEPTSTFRPRREEAENNEGQDLWSIRSLELGSALGRRFL